MKFDFTADEMYALLLSLVARRNTLKSIIDGRESSIYSQGLQTVEAVMEKLFPGSVKSLDEINEKVS